MVALVALCLFSVGAVTADKLVSVQVLFRHGDRAPSSPLPHDIYGASYWPNGWSQLTERGKNETHELGQFLRDRYGKESELLPAIHDPSKVLVRSTSKQRAVDSATNVVRGLYPTPSTTSVEIRVRTPHTQDLLLKPNSHPCEAYDLIVEAQNEKLFRQYNKRFERFFRYLSMHTGYDVSMENVDKVFDAVYREASYQPTVHGLPQPEWLRRKFVDNAGKTWNVYDLILELKRVQRLSEFWTPELSKLRTGFLLGKISRRMQAAAANTSASENFVLLSSHDATLTSLLYNMGTSNDLLTPYAAAVVFELYQDESQNAHYVKVLYRNETTSEPYAMHVPGCPEVRCQLPTFISAMAGRAFWSKGDALNECATPL